MKSFINEIYGTNHIDMAKRLAEAAGLAQLAPSGAVVRLKPNLVVGRPAEGGATTHPGILAGLIEYLQDHGAAGVEVVEGSWVGEDTSRAFAACGYADLSARYGVRLYDLKKDSSTPVKTPLGPVRVCDMVLGADFLINLPVLKGHCQTRMTCAVKNLKGCITDGEKRRFHREGLDEWIAALATAVQPGFTLVDGICGDLDFEEGGNPVRADRMFAGCDVVALDAYGCGLMGMDPDEVGYLGLAAGYGVGSMDAGEVVRLNSPIGGGRGGRTGKVGRLSKHIRDDQACSACYANVIHALQRMDEAGGIGGVSVCVGQGWRGREPECGVGVCCGGEGCPPTPAQVLRALGFVGSRASNAFGKEIDGTVGR